MRPRCSSCRLAAAIWPCSSRTEKSSGEDWWSMRVARGSVTGVSVVARAAWPRTRIFAMSSADHVAPPGADTAGDVLDTPRAGPLALRGGALRVAGYGGGMLLGLISAPL